MDKTRRTYAAGTSAIALATTLALAPVPATAQSLQGTGNVLSGIADISTGPGTTTISVSSPQVVIDWTPTDNATNNGVPINFQPENTTATFRAFGEYAVLNRVIPSDHSRPIVFNGTVRSQIFENSLRPGGTIYFYSPAGIILSSTAVFDVGSLGLTTAAPFIDGNGQWILGDAVLFQYANPSSFIHLQRGAQIQAGQEGSYVAVFAPSIAQNGAIQVNGQAVLVGAETGTINFSPDGLFDIQVSVGSDGDANDVSIYNDGTITGPASSGAGDHHRVYLVAVPKNNLVTMLIERGTNIGFDIASAAEVDGNAVILSAGHNITAGQIDPMTAGIANADIIIGDTNPNLPGTGIDFTSAVEGAATGTVFLSVNRHTNFASDLTLSAYESISANVVGSGALLTVGRDLFFQGHSEVSLSAESGSQVDIVGNATFNGDLSTFGVPVTGAPIFVGAASGASIDVDGTLFASSWGVGFGGANGTGGRILVSAANGTIRAGNVSLHSRGQGSDDESTGGTGGGGLVQMSASENGLIEVFGSTFILSEGLGGNAFEFGGVGGTGLGDPSGLGDGASIIASTGGTISLNGSVELISVGQGGSGSDGGGGIGGLSRLLVDNGTINVASESTVLISAIGYGGAGFFGNGGNGFGGRALVHALGGSIALAGGTSLQLNASGHGGFGDNGGLGGNGGGGTAQIAAFNNLGSASLISLQDALVIADGVGGDGFSPESQGGGSGGNGTGGTGQVTGSAGNGSVSALSVYAQANGVGGAGGFDGGGAGGTGGTGTGGILFVGTSDFTGNVSSSTGSATFGEVSMVSDGLGGSGGDGATGGDGGIGTGGTSHFQVRGTPVTIESLTMSGSGFGGSGGFGSVNGLGGDGVTGNVLMTVRDRSQSSDRGSLEAGSIQGFAHAVSGTGLFDGQRIVRGGLRFDVRNSDSTIDNLLFETTGDILDPLAQPDQINVVNGTAQFGSSFAFLSSGIATLQLDNGTLTAPNVELGALRWALPDTAPAVPGTLRATDSLTISAPEGSGLPSPLGFETYANFDVNSGLFLETPGRFRIGNFTSSAGELRVFAFESVQTGNIVAQGVDLRSNGAIATGSITAAGFAFLSSDEGAVRTSDVAAGAFVDFTAGTDLITGNIDAGGKVALQAGGNINAGNIVAGSTPEDSVSILLSAGGNIVAGDLTAPLAINLFSTGGFVTVGNVDTGDFSVDIAGALTTGNILANNVSLDSEQSVKTGAITADGFAEIDSGGTVSTGIVTAASYVDFSAGTDLTTDNITAGQKVALQAGRSINAGNIVAGSTSGDPVSILLSAGGNILAGNLTAPLAINLFSPGGFVTVGNVDTGDFSVDIAGAVITGNILADNVSLASDQSVATGTVTANGFAEIGAGSTVSTGVVNAVAYVDFTAGTDLTTGNITAGQKVALQAGEDINAGNIVAGSTSGDPVSILLSAGGNILAGNLTAPLAINLLSPGGFVTVGDVDTGDFTVDIAGALTTGNILADNVSLASGQSVATGTISANGFAEIDSGGEVTTGVVNAAGYVDFTAGTNLTTGNITAGRKVALQASGNVNTGDIVAGSTSGDPVSILLSAGGNIFAGNLTAPLAINLFSPGGFVTVGDVDTGDFSVDIFGALTTGAILANNVSLASDQSVSTGTISADGFAEIDSGGAISTGVVNAAGYVDFTAGTNLATGNITAGQKVALQAGGNITAGNIVAGSTSGDPVSILLSAGGNILVSNLTAPLAINLLSPGGFVTVGNVDTGDFSVDIAGALTTGNILADNVSLASGQSVATGTISANGFAEIDSGGAVTTGIVNAAGYVDFNAGTNLTAHNITAGQKVSLQAGGNITAGNIFAGSTSGNPISILLSAGGNILAGNLTAPLAINLVSPGGFVTVADVDTGDFTVDIVGALTTGAISANNVKLASDQGVTTGAISADGFAEIDAEAAILTGVVNAAGYVDFTAGTNLTTGNITAGRKVALEAGGNINARNITAGSTSGDPVSILLTAGGNILAGNLTAPLGIVATSSGGSLTLGSIGSGDLLVDVSGAISTGNILADNLELSSGQSIATGTITTRGYAEIDAGANLTTGAVNTAAYVDFSAGGNINMGAVTAGQNVKMKSGGTLTAGNIGAGSAPGEVFSIGLAAGGNLTTGTLSGPAGIGLLSQTGAIAVGTVNTAGSLLALARTGASFAAVSTGTSSSTNLFVADSSMAALGGPLDSFNPGPIFAATPTPMAGPISFSGPINTGRLIAATTQNFSALGINAAIMNVLAGGLATVGGNWRSDQIFVQSNDIDILAAGLLDGGASGTVRLFSSNSSQMLVGDGLTGSGYGLSSAELGRIRAANIFITARDNSAQDVDMLIGSATVNASQFPSGNGRLVFATLGSANATTPTGRIRVNGALAVTGISGEVELELNSDAVELDTSTGSIAMSNGATGLAGRLEINAENIHVADSAILMLLRADPHYPGHIEELNAPAATQRPEGVLRAENLALRGSDTIYVQNTGTQTAPAGFVTTIEGFEVGVESASLGQIEVVLNGQFVTDQGNVSGRNAFQLAFDPANQGVFGDNLSADSTFNACLIAARSCGGDTDPLASLASEIFVISKDVLSEEPFEQESEDEGQSDAARSPIAPPAPLIDTRPLYPEQDIVEPVAGSGNPALIGSVVNEPTGEEQQQ